MIQKVLIQYILSPLGAVMDKFSEKVRQFLFMLGGLGVVMHTFAHNMSLPKYRYFVFYAIDCVFLGLMILSMLRKDMKPVKFRWPLMICWIAVGVLMLLSGLKNNTNYLAEALLFLVVYPVLFICFNNSDRGIIFRNLIRILKTSVVFYVLCSFTFAPILQDSYPGIFNNTNGAAYYLAACLAFQTAELLYEERFGWKMAGDILLTAMTAALLYYTNSRTGVLAVIVALAGGTGIYLLTHGWKRNVKCLLLLAVTLVLTWGAISNLVYVFQLRSEIDFPYYYNALAGEFYSTKATNDTNNTEQKPNQPNAANKNDRFDASGFNDRMQYKGTTENKTMDQYSTGRISIWLAYAKDLNWTGHAETPTVYIDWLYKNISSTHMTILQIAYESGILAGIFYFLLNIGSGFVAIWFAWKNRNERYAALPLMVTLAFGVMSMLGSSGVSLWYLETFCYYIVSFPIVADRTATAQAPCESGR